MPQRLMQSAQKPFTTTQKGPKPYLLPLPPPMPVGHHGRVAICIEEKGIFWLFMGFPLKYPSLFFFLCAYSNIFVRSAQYRCAAVTCIPKQRKNLYGVSFSVETVAFLSYYLSFFWHKITNVHSACFLNSFLGSVPLQKALYL